MNETEKITKFSDEVVRTLTDGRLVNLTFSAFPKGEVQKVKGTPKSIAGKTVLQLEFFLTEGRVKHENADASDIPSAVEKLISEGARCCQLVASNGSATLLVSKKGAVNATYKLGKNVGDYFPIAKGNNDAKNYIFDGSERFMTELGISNREGRVHDKKQSKFRQINRFTEHVRDIMKYLPQDGRIAVYDLCCGKSYLSFALYAYLTEKLGREVCMICADLKESVMDYCRGVALRLGYSGMKFIACDIADIKPEGAVDLVISLHACDTATDIVLDFAVRQRAKVILSTPCCQHEMFNIMNCPELEFISKYSVLKQKIACAATDALRLAKLEAAGYRTDAIEFIDPEETPKNVLLRGILKKNYSQDSDEARAKEKLYSDSYKYMTGDLSK